MAMKNRSFDTIMGLLTKEDAMAMKKSWTATDYANEAKEWVACYGAGNDWDAFVEEYVGSWENDDLRAPNGEKMLAAVRTEIAKKPMASKPTAKLVGGDGNVFAIIGSVSKALKRAGQPAKAEEWATKARASTSYDAVLALAFDYVEVE